MTRKIFYQKGIVLPVNCEEGAISIRKSASVHGDEYVPVLADELQQGDVVELTADLTVKKATGNKPVIGFVSANPEWEDIEPIKDYTAAEAKTAGMLRLVGVETHFVDVRTVTAKTGENIAVGDFVKFGATGYEKAQNDTGIIALTGQNTDNKIVIGH